MKYNGKKLMDYEGKDIVKDIKMKDIGPSMRTRSKGIQDAVSVDLKKGR